MVTRRDQNEFARLERQIKELKAQARAGSKAMSDMSRTVAGSSGGWSRATTAVQTFGRHIASIPGHLVNLGKNIQWTGRQLEFRFSLPLIAAGVAVTRWAFENEKAATTLKKVYGDLSMTTGQVTAETNALRRGWELLSNQFGVSQKDVIDLAAQWAQAGSSGSGLLERTKSTLEAMIVTELDATQATQGLIVLTQAYGLAASGSAKGAMDLKKALALINVVENETAISTAGIIEVFEKTGGIAHTAGVSIRELTAMAAAMVPVAGSASEAGTFLKTAIQSIVAPTDVARGVLEDLGFATMDAAWNSKTFTERLTDLSKVFEDLTEPQKLQAANDLFGVRQASRGILLLKDWANAQGVAQKALAATVDEEANAQKMRDEIEIFLKSSPQAFSIAMNSIKNSLTAVMIPLLPTFVSIADAIASVADSFNDLNPSTRQWILSGLAILAISGPIISYLGAFLTLFGSVGVVLRIAATAVLGFLGLFLPSMAATTAAAVTATASVDGLTVSVVAAETAAAAGAGGGFLLLAAKFALIAAAIAGLVLVIWKYHDQIRRGLGAIARSFLSFFQAVIRIVSAGAKKVYEWMSYLNPFARHSPSLVEQVDKGIDFIINKYAMLEGMGGSLHNAADAYRDFLDATQSARQGFEDADFAELRDAVAEIIPEAVGALDNLRAKVKELTGSLGPLEAAIEAQRKVVKDWEAALEAMDTKIDEANNLLDSLRDNASSISDALSAARDRLQDLASTPITGMRAMSDEIFENEMAIKRLQLAIMDLEDSGVEVEDLTNQFALLNGQIEGLRGKEKDLRMAGAGSDVLGPIRGQIAVMDAQRRAMGNGVTGSGPSAELKRMRDELEKLQRAGQRLNLEKDLKFDPLTRQIDLMINGMQELPFDEIVAGIQNEKGQIAKLTAEWDQANAAVRDQEAIVKSLQRERDTMVKGLDVERAKLDELEQTYDDITSAIGEMTRAMEEFGASAKAAKAAADAAGSSLTDLPGDFATADFGGGIGREGDLSDIEALIKSWEDGLKTKIDPFKAFREKWDELKNWFRARGSDVMDMLRPVIDAFRSVNWGGMWDGFRSAATAVGDFLTGVWQNQIGPALDWVGEKFGQVWGAIRGMLDPIAAEMSNWGQVISDVWFLIGKAAEVAWTLVGQHIWNALTTIGGWIRDIFGHVVEFFRENGDEILIVVRSVWDMLWGITKNTFELIGGVISGSLETIRGVIHTITSLIKGDWGEVWEGIKTTLHGVWTIIYSIVKNVMDSIWTIIESTGDSIGALWDLLWGGLKLALKSVWSTMLTGVKSAVNLIVDVINKLVEGINWVIGKVPGVGGSVIPYIGHWEGDTSLPGFARGGALPAQVGAGFMTNGPRAIVGEGNPMHPEFVIPTDPSYRGNAMKLLSQLMGQMGLARGGQIPQYGIGGIIDAGIAIGQGIADATDAAMGAARSAAVTVAMQPFLKTFDMMLGAIPGGGMTDIFKQMANNLKNDVYNALKGTPKGANGFLINPTPGGTLIRAGEAGRREALVPLPDNFRPGQGGGGGAVIINGDLVFPNVTDGDDAKAFIDNLRNLTGK